jgi:hypothetical protein
MLMSSRKSWIAFCPRGTSQTLVGGSKRRPSRPRLCDFEETGAPSLVLIDGTALRGGESALAELIAKLQQSAWRDAPIVILDDPDADLMRGFAAGYVARVRLDSNPAAIMQLIDKVLHTAV